MPAEVIALGSLSAALIVVSGALYALLFALGKLQRSRTLLRLAYIAYAVLIGGVLMLGRALELEAYWTIVLATMLVGYLLAPPAIWHLCVATHRADWPDSSPRGGRR